MRKLFILAAGALLASACSHSNEVRVTVESEEDTPTSYMVELEARPILDRLKSQFFYVTDDAGKEIPSQLTYDSLIIFKSSTVEGGASHYVIHPSDTLHRYTDVASGRFYPKRRDDLSYENDLGGYRIYGPGTQAAGEKSFGYDIFFKYPTEELIVPQLYAPETDDSVCARVDSLRKIDDKLADDYIRTFSYHLDHGKGMDSFAVGATLGAGVPAIIAKDSIVYPWCYREAEILDNGPLRFSYRLEFDETTLPTGEKVREQRIVSLDAGSYLNNSKVWYDGAKGNLEIATGFPLRDDNAPHDIAEKGIITYAAPAQEADYGKALLGVVIDNKVDSVFVKDNHILISTTLTPGDTLSYKWGFSWDKTEIPTEEEWLDMLSGINNKPRVTVR